jgi:hypothetical protein
MQLIDEFFVTNIFFLSLVNLNIEIEREKKRKRKRKKDVKLKREKFVIE